MGDERIRDRSTGVLLDAERRGDDVWHEARVRDRRELDKPGAVRVVVESLGGDLERQAGLADAARAEEGQEPRACQCLARLVELVLAADEGRHLLRQVVGRGFQRAQRREVLAQRRMQHLVQTLRAREVAQAHEAQVAQRQGIGQPPAHQIDDRLREQHLAAVRGTHDARGTVHRLPK